MKVLSISSYVIFVIKNIYVTMTPILQSGHIWWHNYNLKCNITIVWILSHNYQVSFLLKQMVPMYNHIIYFVSLQYIYICFKFMKKNIYLF